MVSYQLSVVRSEITEGLRAGMQDFQKLKVWEKSHALALEIYRETKLFPYEEKFGLSSQLRRACSSIAANLAEGSGRTTPRDKARFFAIALGVSI